MQEKLFLFTGLSLLCVSMGVSPESDLILPQQNTFASEETQNIDDHAVAPIRRFAVQQKRNSEITAKLSMENAVPLITKNKKVIKKEEKVIQKEPEPKIHPTIDKADINIRHRIIANEVIQEMPKKCQNILKNFYVRYEPTESRGLGGKSTIILSGLVPDKEFRALFIHEFGHMVDLGCINGTALGKNTQYKDGKEIMKDDDPSIDFYQLSWLNSHTQKKGSKNEDFVSGYAQWDMFEDFAESFTYFVLHREVFIARAEKNEILAAKYNWFINNLPPIYVNSKSEVTNIHNIPWDITKLSYTWSEK